MIQAFQFPCSREVLQHRVKLDGPRDKGIDFDALLPGSSYAIPIGQANVHSLSVLCSKHAKRLGRMFKIHHHVVAGIVEVARIDDGNGNRLEAPSCAIDLPVVSFDAE